MGFLDVSPAYILCNTMPCQSNLDIGIPDIHGISHGPHRLDEKCGHHVHPSGEALEESFRVVKAKVREDSPEKKGVSTVTKALYATLTPAVRGRGLGSQDVSAM